MESTTIDRDTATTEATETVTFHSEAGNYRAVMEPQRRHRVGESSEVEVLGGKTIEFYDGVFTTSDREEIAFLREHDSNGRYFWEVGSDADKPTDASGLIREIVKCGREGDLKRVAEILVAERTNLSRPDVLAACEAVLEDSGEAIPERPNTPLHELQRVRVGPTAGPTPGVSPDPVPGTPMVDPPTLNEPPGAPAAPAPPTGQVPATEATDALTGEAEVPSRTTADARGPLHTGQPGQVGDATVTSDLPPAGSEESQPGAQGDTPAENPGDPQPQGGGAPGAPAAPPDPSQV